MSRCGSLALLKSALRSNLNQAAVLIRVVTRTGYIQSIDLIKRLN